MKRAAEDAEADGGAERSQAEDDADGQHGHGLDVCKFSIQLSSRQTMSKTKS